MHSLYLSLIAPYDLHYSLVWYNLHFGVSVLCGDDFSCLAIKGMQILKIMHTRVHIMSWKLLKFDKKFYGGEPIKILNSF